METSYPGFTAGPNNERFSPTLGRNSFAATACSIRRASTESRTPSINGASRRRTLAKGGWPPASSGWASPLSGTAAAPASGSASGRIRLRTSRLRPPSAAAARTIKADRRWAVGHLFDGHHLTSDIHLVDCEPRAPIRLETFSSSTRTAAAQPSRPSSVSVKPPSSGSIHNRPEPTESK